MLHLISQSPIEAAVLARIDAGDGVVFLGNAVFRLLRNGSLGEQLNRLASRNRLFALSEDLTVRGITAGELPDGVDVIDYKGLVELTVSHRLIQTWS